MYICRSSLKSNNLFRCAARSHARFAHPPPGLCASPLFRHTKYSSGPPFLPSFLPFSRPSALPALEEFHAFPAEFGSATQSSRRRATTAPSTYEKEMVSSAAHSPHLPHLSSAAEFPHHRRPSHSTTILRAAGSANFAPIPPSGSCNAKSLC